MQSQSTQSIESRGLPRERRFVRRLDLAFGLLLGGFFPFEVPGGPDASFVDAHQGAALPPRLRPDEGSRFEELGLSELRQIRGVGPARARSIRQALWRSGSGLPLQEIPGVGEKTAASIESWLSTRGLPPGGPEPASSLFEWGEWSPQAYRSE